MNIKKHLKLFFVLLSIVCIANIVGIIIGAVKRNFDVFFVISLVTLLVNFLIFLYFIKAIVKLDYMKKSTDIVKEQRNISLLIFGISFVFFVLSIILSYI